MKALVPILVAVAAVTAAQPRAAHILGGGDAARIIGGGPETIHCASDTQPTGSTCHLRLESTGTSRCINGTLGDLACVGAQVAGLLCAASSAQCDGQPQIWFEGEWVNSPPGAVCYATYQNAHIRDGDCTTGG